MASRYHWLTVGIDTQFNLALPTAQAIPVALPAGAEMKRFIVRQCRFQAKNQGTDENSIVPLVMTWDVHFTSGPNNGRSIFQTYRAIPMYNDTFTPITGSSRYCWWNAGDNELGFNQRSTYGKASGAAENLQFTYSLISNRFGTFTNLFGEWSFVGAVLYYL